MPTRPQRKSGQGRNRTPHTACVCEGRLAAPLAIEGAYGPPCQEFGSPEELPARHRRRPEEELLVPYNGSRTMYEREGFSYDRPKGQGNSVMVREAALSTRG